MGRLTILYIAFTAILLVNCTFHKKVLYNIPADLTEDQRILILRQINEGKELYHLHCSKCHGIFTKGKDGIPDFTQQQFDNYSAYAIKRDPKNHAVADHMSQKQLHDVIMFLKARKRKTEKA